MDLTVTAFVFAALLVLLRYYARRRGMRRLAERLGLEFEPLGGRFRDARFGDRSLDDLYWWGKAGNVMHGRIDGVPLAVMDYSYRLLTEDFNDRPRRTHTLVAFPMDDVRLPKFRIAPRGWEIKVFGGIALLLLRRITGIKPSPELRFPDSPRFDSRYWVSTEADEAVRLLLVDDALAEICRYRRMAVESREGWLLIHLDRRRLPVRRIRRFMECAIRLRHALADSSAAAEAPPFHTFHRQPGVRIRSLVEVQGGKSTRRL